MDTQAALCRLGLCSILIIAAPCATGAAGPDDLRSEAARLLENARRLKAEGRLEESEKLAQEAKQLRAEAAAIAEAQDQPRRDLERLRAQLKELEANNRPEAAAEVREQIARVERAIERGGPRPGRQETRERQENLRREIEELHRLGRPDEAARLERRLAESEPSPADAERLGRSPGFAGDPAARWRHLREAIGHLHAAGWHEQAERLEREAERRRTELEPRPVAPRRALSPAEPIAQAPADLKADLAELRRSIAELRQALRDTREQFGRQARGQR
jgi:hypothetical protein